MPNYKIDEIDVLESYLDFLGHVCENGDYEDEEDERKIKENIGKIKVWMKEIKTTGETHSDLKWKIYILSEVLDVEKNTEILPFDGDLEGCEEGKKIQKEYVKGIKEWLKDMKASEKKKKK